jgi:hypothetical protein
MQRGEPSTTADHLHNADSADSSDEVGTETLAEAFNRNPHKWAVVCEATSMDSIIYLVGLVVVVMFILSLLGL